MSEEHEIVWMSTDPSVRARGGHALRRNHAYHVSEGEVAVIPLCGRPVHRSPTLNEETPRCLRCQQIHDYHLNVAKRKAAGLTPTESIPSSSSHHGRWL